MGLFFTLICFIYCYILFSCVIILCVSGKLHRHIVQLQVSEGTAVRKLEESRKKVTKLEAMVLRMEQKIDDKDSNIYYNKKQSQNKVQHLKRNLHVSLRT